MEQTSRQSLAGVTEATEDRVSRRAGLYLVTNLLVAQWLQGLAGSYWWHVRINCNDGVLDMHLELRWGVGHVALLVFVSQHSTKLIPR